MNISACAQICQMNIIAYVQIYQAIISAYVQIIVTAYPIHTHMTTYYTGIFPALCISTCASVFIHPHLRYNRDTYV